MSESENIEWKETWRDEYLKWVCGFANAQGGDGLWSRFPFSIAYQVPDSLIGSATTPKTTQERSWPYSKPSSKPVDGFWEYVKDQWKQYLPK